MFGIVARPAPVRSAETRKAEPSVSVVIPCRNESGHIAPLVESLPRLPAGSEFLFVEGHSTDDTAAVIERASWPPTRSCRCASSGSRARARATPCASASRRRRATCC